jgi:hypothetical protein
MTGDETGDSALLNKWQVAGSKEKKYKVRREMMGSGLEI